MNILGIDYGRSKVGIAIGINGFAEPLKVIRYKDIDSLKEDIKKTIEDEGVTKVVVGISEGEMGKESMEFGKELGIFLEIPVETHDETLTSKDAQKISIAIGVKRKKRKEMEDAYAASLMLQDFLDSIRA
jgi:putative Holliday junction resolvase